MYDPPPLLVYVHILKTKGHCCAEKKGRPKQGRTYVICSTLYKVTFFLGTKLTGYWEDFAQGWEFDFYTNIGLNTKIYQTFYSVRLAVLGRSSVLQTDTMVKKIQTCSSKITKMLFV